MEIRGPKKTDRRKTSTFRLADLHGNQLAADTGPAAIAAIADLGARAVTEGSNLAVLETKSAGELLFREQVAGTWLASPVQVYLDLLRGEGRAKELAEHLRRERIRF